MKSKVHVTIVLLIGIIMVLGCSSQYIRTAELAIKVEDNPEKAIKNLRMEIEQNPQNAEAYLFLSRIYSQYENDYDKSFQYAKKAVEIDPSKEPGALAIYTTCWAQLHNQGVDKFEEEEFSTALKFFHKANEIFPDSLVTEKMIASTYVQLDSLVKAKELLTDLIEEYPKDLKAIESLAKIHFNNGDYKTSAKYFKKLLELEPSNKLWSYNIAVCFNNLGNYKKALKYAPENKELLKKIAILEYENENFENSIKYLRKILEIDQNDKDALKLLSFAYSNLKDWDNLLKFSQKWKNIEPDSKNANKLIQLAKQNLNKR